MRKLIAIFVAVMLLLLPCAALAETTPPIETAAQTAAPAAESVPPQGTEAPMESEVSGGAQEQPEFDDSCFNDSMTGILLDADTGEILYSRNPDQIIYPASTTKIMTGLLAIELNGGTLDGEITVGTEVNEFSSSSSLMGLKQNETVTIEDLLYGLMMCSGNDAANALAVHFGGSVDGFLQKMNEKAQELGMTNTHFANPHGLDMRNLGQDHHSTAADMAKLAMAAYQNPILMEIMDTPSYTITSTELNGNIRESPVLSNGNYLIATPEKEPLRSKYAKYLYGPATGMKTGLLQNIEGNQYYGCLVASASKDGTNLIAAVFADTSNYGADGPALDRWDAVTNLFEYAFDRFVAVDLSQYIEPFTTTEQLSNFAENDPQAGWLSMSSGQLSQTPGIMMLDKQTAQGLADGTVKIGTEVKLTRPLAAPITQGEEMGTVVYSLNGEELCTAPLNADRKVYQEGEEKQTREEYDLPGVEFELWWLWIIIPAGVVGGLFLARAINLNRRRRGRSGYGYMRNYPATRSARYSGANKKGDIRPTDEPRTRRKL